ncbi:MAG: hypothetical protein JSV34_02865, partial [Candidatus Omnitrophota bacterium]
FAQESLEISTVLGMGKVDIEDNAYLATGTGKKVGIGTTTPEFKLSLDDDGGIIAKGTLESGNSLTTTGAGVRMIWYPRKAAFRAGGVSETGGGTEWNDENIGNYSTAMGYRTIASGLESFATGHITTASGNYSTAMGRATYATGDDSTAMGALSAANGWCSVAMGYYVTAGADYSVAIGRGYDADNILVNNTEKSMMVGFNSDIPTLFVGPSAGAGTTGKVGIGTTNPLTALSVIAAKPTVYDGSAPNAADAIAWISNIQTSETTNDQAQIQFGVNGGAQNRVGSIGLIAEDAGNRKASLVFTTDNGFTRLEKMRITGDGNVGIGTTAPSQTLTVKGTHNLNPLFPDGMEGEHILTRFGGSYKDYDVEEGKTLYVFSLCNMNTSSMEVTIGGTGYYKLPGESAVSFKAPLVVKGGNSLEPSVSSYLVLTGYKVDAGVTIINEAIKDGQSYSVSEGKTLYILTAYNVDSTNRNEIVSSTGQGDSVLYYLNAGESVSFNTPLVVPQGNVKSFTRPSGVNEEVRITGYEM